MYILCSIYSLEIFLMMAILTCGRGFLTVDLISIDLIMSGSSLVWLSSKEPACSAGDVMMQLRSLSQEDPLEKEMATQSGILAWQVPWLEKPVRCSLWEATVYAVAKSQKRLSDFTFTFLQNSVENHSMYLAP